MRNIPGITFHKDYLDESSSWWNMSAVEQLGNIGSEVGRSIAAKASGDQEKFEGATWRMYELFDLAMADPRWRRRGSLREICRAREVVSDHLFGESQYGETDISLERYFLAYGIMANEERRRKRAEKKLASSLKSI
ncbi:hypothetical protein AUK10_01340 [Candidatus Gracilibacteria bacterium CG2_30_37_12]|nr:MAG: hypothetical protein AUK10_01340 [Candidatus Gracilibacteria bacterium CG2_30_37_12]